MTYLDVIKKALECNGYNEFCEFGNDLEYSKMNSDSQYSRYDLEDNFTISFDTQDETEGLISLRGDFGNIRIKLNDGIIKAYKRFWNEDHSEFKDEPFEI